MKTNFALILLGILAGINGFLLENRKICYEGLDCFTNNKPFNNALDALPDSPENVGVTFKVFTRENPTVGTVVHHDDLDSIANSGYSGTKPTKFIIHGYMGYATAQWVINITRGFLSKEDANVVTVDWQKGASKSYQISVANTRTVGAMGAQLLETFRDKYNARMEDVHLTGHSLGAQTCGYIGRRVPRVGRITGFDPAGPLFENYATEVRLDPSDALFVDVIHSDALPLEDAGFGTKSPCGHIDFYPNGGGHQPGCPPTVSATLEEMVTLRFSEAFSSVACSHQRSYIYFAESLENNDCQFTAYPCDSYNDFKHGKCKTCGSQPCPQMGYYANQSSMTGSFYLTTNDHYPFCRSPNESG